MVSTQNLLLSDGRTLRVHDSADAHSRVGAFTVLWHHGSPQTGALLDPLLAAAAVRGIRLLSYGRPSYGGSTALPGRTVASAAADVAQLAEQLDLDQFAVMGASGGGPHALACAALLPERVSATACLASLAPADADGLDWFDGMASDGASLRAALLGRAARDEYEQTAEFDPESFIDRDYAALAGRWACLGTDVGLAAAEGTDGLIDDDLAFVLPWEFSVGHIVTPVLYVQGGRDRVVPPAHATWLLQNTSEAELWLRPRDGHIAVLDACAVAMDWLREHS
jgi:pimeloyl-ACP methyl ester carboxylesterase